MKSLMKGKLKYSKKNSYKLCSIDLYDWIVLGILCYITVHPIWVKFAKNYIGHNLISFIRWNESELINHYIDFQE